MSELDRVSSINRTSLHEELTDRIRNMVVEGVLVAGEKVPERELCEKLGVSRTPMREALKVVAADGLLDLVPGRGARVSAITLTDLEEVFPLMAALEALAGELACEKISNTQLTKIKNAHQEMLKHFKNQNLTAYFKQNEKIHETILAAAGNETLKTMYKSLALRVRRARYMANMTPKRWQQAVDEHEEILVALDNRDGQALGAILKRHLQNKFDTVRVWMENLDDVSSIPNNQ